MAMSLLSRINVQEAPKILEGRFATLKTIATDPSNPNKSRLAKQLFARADELFNKSKEIYDSIVETHIEKVAKINDTPQSSAKLAQALKDEQAIYESELRAIYAADRRMQEALLQTIDHISNSTDDALKDVSDINDLIAPDASQHATWNMTGAQEKRISTLQDILNPGSEEDPQTFSKNMQVKRKKLGYKNKGDSKELTEQNREYGHALIRKARRDFDKTKKPSVVEQRIRVMQAIADGTTKGPPGPDVAAAFVDRAKELNDKLPQMHKNIRESHEARLEDIRDTLFTPKQYMQALKNEHNRYKKEINAAFKVEKRMKHSLIQASDRLTNPRVLKVEKDDTLTGDTPEPTTPVKETFTEDDVNRLISPDLSKIPPTGDPTHSNDLTCDFAATLYSKEDDERSQYDKIIALKENHDSCEYNNSDTRADRAKAALETREERNSKINKVKTEFTESFAKDKKNFFLNQNIKNSYLEAPWYKNNQKHTFESMSKEDRTAGNHKGPDTIRLKDMKNINIHGVQFDNSGDGVFRFNVKSKVSDGDGNTHSVNQSDKLQAMVQLLSAMQAEGKTKFRCTSNNPKTIKAFERAASALNIPRDQLAIYKKHRRTGDLTLVKPPSIAKSVFKGTLKTVATGGLYALYKGVSAVKNTARDAAGYNTATNEVSLINQQAIERIKEKQAEIQKAKQATMDEPEQRQTSGPSRP